MIIKIINGKTKTIQPAVDYVCDDKKTAKNFNEIKEEYFKNEDLQLDMTLEEFYLSCEDNINRALNYIANEDKIGGFISGYLCDPELAEQQFRTTKEINLARVGKELKDDNGNYFYHIIQSFPEELEISDEEVHQCGVELVERLGLYQAVITSHIHPAVDESGEVHGSCKHNHIVLNSHIYHEFVDERSPHKMKYHDCKESYSQLQLINDQIAIEHGLPIIINQDSDKVYSWYEAEEKKRGKSWKERVRIDINNAMKVSTDIDSFIKTINAANYTIRIGHSQKHGDYITYTCPDGKHRVRDYVLGRGYTKSELEAFWEIKRNISDDLLLNNEDKGIKIESIINNSKQPLYIKFIKTVSNKRKEKLRQKNRNIKEVYTNYLPLDNSHPSTYKAEATYFMPNMVYEIVNEKHQVVIEVTGQEVLEYFTRVQEKSRKQEQEEQKALKQKSENEFYSNPNFINSVTNRPYKIRMWDNVGRKRTIIELLVILAIVVINNESEKWKANDTETHYQNKNNPIYGKRDWKVQNMVDTIKVAREEEITTLSELEEKLDKVGKETTKSKVELKRLQLLNNKMQVLHEAIENYNKVKEVCEQLQNMPNGEEKEKALAEHQQELEMYKKNKAIMYRHKATTEAEVNDFMERYVQVQERLETVSEQVKKNKAEYSRLSKLKYNLQLAQNQQYCYGPKYEPQKKEIIPEQEKQV